MPLTVHKTSVSCSLKPDPYVLSLNMTSVHLDEHDRQYHRYKGLLCGFVSRVAQSHGKVGVLSRP